MRPRLRQHHPPLDLVLLHPPQQQPHVVPRLPLVQQLAEHLHPRHHRLLRAVEPHHRHLLPHLHHPPLDPPRRHRAPPRDREHVLHRHQERLVDLPLRLRDVACPARPSARRSSAHSLRIPATPAPRAPSPGSSACRPPGTRTRSAAPAPPAPPGPAAPRSSTMSHLVQEHHHDGTFTCRASRMCSRVCGIGPSAADTTRIAPSICAAPVIMFFT